MKLEFDQHPSPEDFRTLVDGVRSFNRDRTDNEWPRSVAFYLRDAEQKIIAGVQGTLWGRSMHIDVLWVDEQHRGSGYGSKLMTAIEDYAAAHAHPLIYLETTSFQALPFYEGLGYRIFGELSQISDGHTLYFLKKEITLHAESLNKIAGQRRSRRPWITLSKQFLARFRGRQND